MKRDELPSLLLLPFPPKPPSRLALNAAYRPSLAAAISKVRRSDHPSKLVVAVACPILNGLNPKAKTLAWSEAQSLVAGLYTIISVICAELSVATYINGGPGSVDSTIVLVDHDRQRRFSPDVRPAIEPNSTVVVDMPTFASAYYPWNFIFHVNSELGLQLHQTYLKFAEGRQTLLQDQLVPLDGGLSMNIIQPGLTMLPPQMTGHSVVCVGGTFDHLHPGHKLLLSAGAYLLRVPEQGSAEPCTFVIGVAGDGLLKNKKFVEYVQTWEERTRNVLGFLCTLLELSPRGWQDSPLPIISEKAGDFQASFRNGTINVQCVVFHDIFGPTITRQDISALVVSAETASGGEAVNQKRVEQGWKALELFQVDVLDAKEVSDETVSVPSDFASKLSSTSIREQLARSRAS